MTFFDSHCHLDEGSWADPTESVIARARAAGVRYLVTIGGNDGVDYARAAVARAETDPEIWATVGIHPCHATLVNDESFAAIEALSSHPKVVAIGESGLDYAWEKEAPREVQVAALRRFTQLARRTRKPLVLHIRDAWDDCRRLFEEEAQGEVVPLVHCFTGTLDDAKAWVALGAYISIPGIVTFKNAGQIPEAAAWVPEDRLLVETDSPWLAPIPFRGRKNEPAYIVHTATRVAELRGVSVEHIAQIGRAHV